MCYNQKNSVSVMFGWLRPQNISKHLTYGFMFGEFFGLSQPNTSDREWFLNYTVYYTN